MDEDKKTVDENIKDEDQQRESIEDKDKNVDKKEDEPTITESQLKARLERAEKKQADKYNKLIEDLKEEIKKSKMKEDEAKEYEDQQKEKKYQEAVNELNYMKMSRVASSKLQESGIPADDTILDLLTQEDEESTENAVESFASLVNNLVNEKLKTMARDKAPKASNDFNSSSDDDFDILSYANKRRRI